MIKHVLNKWQIDLDFYKRIEYLDGRRTFVFGIFKLTSFPEEGVLLSKKNYKGFIWEFTILLKRGR